jgi:uncharacterized membrane protein (UPF0136 family)
MGFLNGVVMLYALLNIGGGVAGYFEKNSLPSLISGIVAGILLLGGAALAVSKPRAGYIIATIVAVADLGFFATRYMKSHAVWPALVMIVASVVVLICLGLGHFAGRKA